MRYRQAEKAKARERAEEWKRQHPNYSPPPGQPHREQNAIDGQYRKTIARRLRQKEAMDAGLGFSTSQQPGSAGVITWSDPLITDVRLVRLVLGADRGSREMTVDEESDYWYWKARGK